MDLRSSSIDEELGPGTDDGMTDSEMSEWTLTEAVHDYLDFHNADELREVIESLLRGNGI